MKAAKRIKALLLALCMLLTSVALAENVSTPTDLTPVPTEAVTEPLRHGHHFTVTHYL